MSTNKTLSLSNLAAFGGEPLFAQPKSTSNLLQPDVERYLHYSRTFHEQGQYTNNGPNVQLLEQRLAEFHQTKHCVTFASGFWAIALAMRELMLPGRNEIIMPSLTYRRMTDISAWVELHPHFCEVDPNTLAMTADTVAQCINENTALILGVHPIVNCAAADELVALGEKHGIPVLFDSVESVFEETNAGRVGGFGEAECFSLHACKLLNGFGGGYLTTNNTELAKKLASQRSYGFTAVDHVGYSGGLNAKLNEMHAAMTLASLDNLSEQVEKNKGRYYVYKQGLESLPGVRLLEFDESLQSGYKNIVVELTQAWPLSRAHTIKLLNAERVLARAHYDPPLHLKKWRIPMFASNCL